MQAFATTTPVTAHLTIPAARIHATATDRADATVEIQPTDPTRNRDVKAARQTTATLTDGVLTIRTTEPGNQYFGPTGSVEITLHLPAGSHLTARTATSELHTTGPLGDIDVEGAHRNIHIDEATSVRLTAVDGDVEITRVTGPAHITTARGRITVTEATHGTLELRTQMGDITIGATPGASAALDARTGLGRIHNALKNTGTTALTIHATTGQGDITARSL